MGWPAREATKSHETCNHPDLKPPHDFTDKQTHCSEESYHNLREI